MPTARADLPSSKGAARGPQRITSWSFSRLRDYLKCPAYAKFKVIDKLKEPEGPALARGSAIHEQAQVFAQQSARKRVPVELETFEAEFRELQRQKATLVVEQQWCFTRDWKKTGWFDADAWLRVVVDAAHTEPFVTEPQGLERSEKGLRLKIIDHKTGRVYDDNEDQLELYALTGLLQYPDVDEVVPQLWYLDHGVLRPDPLKTYTRKDLPRLKKKWEQKSRAMLADTVFRPRPGKACTWCAFSRGKGGPCKY